MSRSIPTVTVSALPACDVCRNFGRRQPAHFDAPATAFGGAWGYLCKTHYRQFAAGTGTRLVEEVKS